ncbi:LPD29 domain-containing protein [Burkholderia glumae]|uniref:LPD29 domain-containing protein n=1 Tax=Burkholderia glumae TaxID=337 RepID=UPI0021503B93|nr:LPD29 domain-containing protein [Burkholderia glumae]
MATTQQTRTTNANRAFPAPQAPQTASIHSKTTPEALNTVLTLVETAQLVLDVMAEAFPGVPVFVKTRQADDQTRIHVEWTDGPTEQQVKKLLLPLQSSTPGQWGGTTPVEHFRLTAQGPQRVQLTADRITVRRRFSDGLVTSVLQRLAHRHVGRLDPETRKLLTVESFKKGPWWPWPSTVSTSPTPATACTPTSRARCTTTPTSRATRAAPRPPACSCASP